MKNPIFAKTVSTKTVTVGNRSLRNHNKLLWQVDGADGVKTGFTKAAGRILVSSAVREGRRLVAVTINDGNDWVDHAQMLNDGFANYHVERIVTEGDCLGRVAVMGGQKESASVVAAEDFSYALSENEQPYVLLSGPGFDYAPVAEGQEAGFAYICIGESTVGKIAVKYSETVEQFVPEKKHFWENWFGGNK